MNYPQSYQGLLKMKIVGHRLEPQLSFSASAELLRCGARFNEQMQRVAGGSTFIPKGVYRFRSMEEAEAHRIRCVARGLAGRAAS